MGYDFFKGDDEKPEYLRNESSDEGKHIAPQDTAKEIDLFAQQEEPVNEEVNESDDESNEEVRVESETVDSEVEVQPEDVEVEEKAAMEEAIKKLSASFGETSIDVPAEAKFRHKVDGEEVEVSLQDLLNNYSGKESWDRKFTDLDKERQNYKKDLEQVNQYINQFAEVSKKDKVDGLIKLAEIVGLNPLEYKKQLRSELLNKYGEYLSMDEDQRLHYEQAEELEYLRRQQETEARMRAEQQAQAELQQRYSEIQQTHEIDDDRLNYLANELRDVYKVDVTPETVTELHTSLVRLDRVDNALKQVNPNFIEDDQKVVQLESLLRGNPQMTDDQLLDYATKLWGNDIEKAVVNLAKKAPVTKEKAKKPEKSHNYSPKLNHVGNSLNFFD